MRAVGLIGNDVFGARSWKDRLNAEMELGNKAEGVAGGPEEGTIPVELDLERDRRIRQDVQPTAVHALRRDSQIGL